MNWCIPVMVEDVYCKMFDFKCTRHCRPYKSWNNGMCMMKSSNGNIFSITGPLWRESTGHRWVPFTKASDKELWCFLWSAPEQMVEQKSGCQWFETQLCSLWHYCNGCMSFYILNKMVKILIFFPLRSEFKIELLWSTQFTNSLWLCNPNLEKRSTVKPVI